MPKKTRKQKQRSAARRQSPAVPGSAGLDTPAVGTVDDAQAEQEVALDTGTPTVEPAITIPAAVPAPAPAAAPAPAPSSGRKRIERLSTPAATASSPAARPGRAAPNAVSMFEPLPSDDAAIPFDRVPYVPSDLRRVAIMAVIMVVVIIIAAVIVSHVVT